MNKINLIVITILMFFKSSAVGNYEKVFYDFNIQDINGDVINLKNFETKQFF